MENSIIIAAKEGSVEAFKEIVDFYLPKMRPVCLRYVRTTLEADDVLQEAFLKIHSNLHSFKFSGSFDGWVRRIIVNTALNHIKKDKQFYTFENLDEINPWIVETENDEVEMVVTAETDALLKIIEDLPPGYKTVFNLYVFDDYSHKEIAEMLNISEGSSRSQYSKAKKLINKLLSGLRMEERSSLKIRKNSNE